jgi:23S rRNA pseudouridine2605 synthase
MPAERLQKVIAQSGLASRRAVEQLIADGRVTVNGTVAVVGQRADPATDAIVVNGTPLAAAAPTRHLAIHKPHGFLSSARDERGRRSVLSLVPRGTPGERLWPAGRLDVDSEGLMLVTNDGAWANRVLHPRYGVERTYAVLVDPPPGAATLRELRAGMTLDDGPARFLAARPAPPPPEIAREAGERGGWVRVSVAEGRKREVRRLFAAAGLRVRRLVRVAIGPIELGGLAAGECRSLQPHEVEALAGQRPVVAAPRRGAGPGRRGARREHLAVAIDGPSGSGKSTVGYALAQRIGATFVDTGLMYRALTLAAIEQGVDPDDGAGLARLAARSRIHVRRPRRDETDRFETVLLARRDVTHEVRTPRIDRLVSAVSRHAPVRRAMVRIQQATASVADTVMVGRDIGTVVLPDATLKVYLTATTLVRAARRAAEMGRPDRADAYLAEIEQRDAADSGRAVAPLRVAPGALVLDTGELDVDECIDAIAARLPKRARGAGRGR